MPSMRVWTLLFAAGITTACACAARAPTSRAPSNAAAETSASPARHAPAPPSSEASGQGARRAASTDAWQVRVHAKFDEVTPPSMESWATLEHAWDEPCGPGKVVAQRRLCLPRGKYVFESRSSDHVDVTIDGGESLIAPRIELYRTISVGPTELSRPIAIDGCVLARATMDSKGCFPRSRIAVTVRTALDREPCDERLYPKDSWNACIYAGRRQEELLQRDTWRELVSPWKTNEGPSGWEDNFSVEARTTACFATGKYVFHTRVPARRLALFIDGKLVVDPEPATPRNVFDSGPFALSGCHELRVTYSARDRDTSFEARWAKVGSALERTWAEEALACDPACASDARCVPAAPFGITRTNARICLPRGRRGSMGEACSASAPCGGPEIFCCRPGGSCGGLPGVCTYLDR